MQKIRRKFTNQGKEYSDDGKLFVSDAYIRSNHALFDLKDDTFNNCTRTLLVDSILNNFKITFLVNNQMQTLIGLPLLITENYFDEGFVLHDQTCHRIYFKGIENLKESNKDYGPNSIEYIEALFNHHMFSDQFDLRFFLQENWASLKNLFKFQPLREVRDYFGEKNAIYFGYVGSFITMLWFPALVGVFFFIVGISLYYTYLKNNIQSLIKLV
jgi:hypothetical protein